MTFDPTLFKKKTGYKPHVSYSTEIKKHDKDDDYVTLHLDNESLVSVPVISFFHFIFKNKINIQSNIFSFPLVLDKFSEPHTEEAYNIWLAHSQKQSSNSISLDELIPGRIYLLEDEKTHFFFVGKKSTISYNVVKKSGDIKVSKIQDKYIGYEVYKHDNFKLDEKSLYDRRILFLSNAKKIIKDVKKAELSSFENILLFIKTSCGFVYFEDKKPSFSKFKLEFKEYSEKEILEFSKIMSFIQCWHKLKSGVYISHSLGIYDKFESDKEFYFHMSSGYIYNKNLDNLGLKYFNSRSYMEPSNILASLSPCRSNDSFRIAPQNYYLLELVAE